MVSGLAVGLTLTVLAWIGLVATVLHGRYVIKRIAAGEYTKGLLRNRETENV